MKYTGMFSTLTLLAATTVAALPSANLERGIHDRIYPYSTYRRWVKTGQLVEDPQDQPLIVKSGPANNDETTAFVTFNFDHSVEGRTCKLNFNLLHRDTSTGSQSVEVFSLIDPPPQGPGSRDQDLGRIHVPAPGFAEWVTSYHGMPEFPCPAGELMGIEFVGVGDEITMQWDIGVSGPTVQVL